MEQVFYAMGVFFVIFASSMLAAINSNLAKIAKSLEAPRDEKK